MAVVHREDGGAAGCREGGAVEEQLTPVSACREEEGCEEEGRRKGGWGAFQRQGTLRVQVEASGT